MKKLFLLIAVIVTLAQFDVIAHGAANPLPTSETATQPLG
jgi:hypothetical protein